MPSGKLDLNTIKLSWEEYMSSRVPLGLALSQLAANDEDGAMAEEWEADAGIEELKGDALATLQPFVAAGSALLNTVR